VRAGWGLVLRAALLELATPVLVRQPVRRLEAVLRRLGPPSAAPAAVVDAVERAFRFHPLERTCLTRGIPLCYLLRRSGTDVSLVFGVRSDGDDWVGHCWLVLGGRPYLEDVDPHESFTEMLSIPSHEEPAR
jgi:hypothetical protein